MLCDTPSVAGKGRQPTLFLETVTVPWSEGQCQPQTFAKTLVTKLWMDPCLESVWQTEQKPYPNTEQAPEFPRRATGRAALASRYLYVLQVLVFICPLPGEAAGHRLSGSRWKAGDLLPECSEGDHPGAVAILGFGSHGLTWPCYFLTLLVL